MKTKSLTRVVAVAAATLLLLTACGSDDDSGSSVAATTAAPATTEAALNMTPGDGVSVVAGRASWSTGYVQAEIFTALLRELGYNVSESADMELGPQNAFMAMAEGQMDFWANSWMPGHSSWLMGERTDGSLIGDAVTVLGEEIMAGGLQGFLIEKGFADEYGIKTFEDLDNNADAIAAYDATDANPGNGLVDIMGCPEDWTCDNIINSMIKGAGYKNIVQVKAGYDPMWAQATDMVNEGLPVVAYTWTPSAYITTIRPGDNAYWIGLEYILDDSNPMGQDGGEELSAESFDPVESGPGMVRDIGGVRHVSVEIPPRVVDQSFEPVGADRHAKILRRDILQLVCLINDRVVAGRNDLAIG